MIVRLACGALQGVDAFRVDLEVDFLRKGMPAFVMVGLAEGAVREAKERVFAAMRSCGFTLPAARITVNVIFLLYVLYPYESSTNSNGPAFIILLISSFHCFSFYI